MRCPVAVVSLAVGFALLASAGCGGGSSRSAGSSAAQPSGPAAAASAGGPTTEAPIAVPDHVTTTEAASTMLVPPPTAPPDDLAATTAIPPLDGFTEIANGPGLGVLDQAAASDGDPRERDALSRFGFREGHARGFAKGSEEMLVTVLRFASAADATAYLNDTIESSLVGNGSSLFPLPVPGATGYREQGAGQDGEPFVTYGAIFARGDRCFEQLVRSPATISGRSEADAASLARRQADRVGG